MCRKEKFGSLAYDQALQSVMNFKHGAIITKGSKVIVSGMNHGDRTSALGQIHSSVHAEIDVASQLINRFIRKKTSNKYEYKSYLKKYIIWVVRAPTYKTGQLNNDYMNSLPCRMCINKLITLGFSKIGYSNNEGGMTITNLDQIEKIQISSAQKQYGEHYKY
jgi:deoxycytidylate deaminase